MHLFLYSNEKQAYTRLGYARYSNFLNQSRISPPVPMVTTCQGIILPLLIIAV